MEEKHVRRKRYSGKYPKKYEEKYKELNPEKYADTVEHVKKKGSTPAGMHISIMVEEILETLNIKPGENGLDCTFGYGGHSKAMLEKLEGKGHLTSLDVDLEESAKTLKRLREQGFSEDILSLVNTNFANIDEVCNEYGKFDFILADLGVSSMQIDNPERGFSYKIDGPLDLRMDRSSGESAAERLKTLSREELCGMLLENSDEPFAEIISAEIYKAARNKKKPLETTKDLKEVVEAALVKAKETDKEVLKKTLARVFQAIRIDINHEYEALHDLLSKLPDCMNEGGRVVFLTFHSGEDRLVKKMFKEFKKEGLFKEISEDVLRPGAKECAENGRAKSTKLRWAIK